MYHSTSWDIRVVPERGWKEVPAPPKASAGSDGQRWDALQRRD